MIFYHLWQKMAIASKIRKGGDQMRKIRNANNKLVCEVDEEQKEVIIILKGCKTIVRFTGNGSIEVEHTKLA
jgi:hypothetical protein